MAQLNAGTYLARAKSWGLSITGTGKEQIGVEFAITAADNPEDVGRTINWYGFFTEVALARTIESLRHCGWTGIDLTDLDGIETNEVQITVEMEEYKGKMQAKVRWVNRASAALGTMDAVVAKAFAARMKAQIAALGANPKAASKGAAKRPTAPPPNRDGPPPDDRDAPPPSDEDVPF